MDDGAHILFVYSHAEGDGSDKDIGFPREERVLDAGSGFRRHAGVVGTCFDLAILKPCGQVVRVFSGTDIDDAGGIAGRLQKFKQSIIANLFIDEAYATADIFLAWRKAEGVVCPDVEQADQVFPDADGSRGC